MIAAPALAQSARSVWTGVYTTEQATRGEQLYFAAAPNATAMISTDASGRRHWPAVTFIERWDGAALKKLFERMEDDAAGQTGSTTHVGNNTSTSWRSC